MKTNTANPDLPTRCACGGTLIYSFGPGDYIACVCDRCTPVVKVDVERLENPMKVGLL